MPSRQRSRGTGRYITTIDTIQIDTQIAELRAQGLTLRQIAAEIGYESESGIARALERAYARVPAEGGQLARRIELDRLDRWTRKAEEILANPGPQVDRLGRPVINEKTGQPYPNQEIVLQAIDRLVRLSERRARIMGIDAAKRSLSMSIDTFFDGLPPGELAAHMRHLRAEMGWDPDGEDRPPGGPAAPLLAIAAVPGDDAE